jgi:hypothetical protein
MAAIDVSTDVETDGPIPGPHPMLSFASAAFQPDKTLASTVRANLELLPGAAGHPRTMAGWAGQPAAWDACRQNPQSPETAMRADLHWLKALPARPVFVAYPAAFDVMVVSWDLTRFTGESPFAHAVLDIKTYAMALMRSGYRAVSKCSTPRHWFDAQAHTYVALDDALEQGMLFGTMLAGHARP